jgi:MFS family permease
MSPMRRPRPGEAAKGRRFIRGVYYLWLTFCVGSALVTGAFLLFLAAAWLNPDWRGEHTVDDLAVAAAFALFYLGVSIAFVFIGRYVLLERLLPRFAPPDQSETAGSHSDESPFEEPPWQNP